MDVRRPKWNDSKFEPLKIQLKSNDTKLTLSRINRHERCITDWCYKAEMKRFEIRPAEDWNGTIWNYLCRGELRHFSWQNHSSIQGEMFRSLETFWRDSRFEWLYFLYSGLSQLGPKPSKYLSISWLGNYIAFPLSASYNFWDYSGLCRQLIFIYHVMRNASVRNWPKTLMLISKQTCVGASSLLRVLHLVWCRAKAYLLYRSMRLLGNWPLSMLLRELHQEANDDGMICYQYS